jgi:hypothetical protein
MVKPFQGLKELAISLSRAVTPHTLSDMMKRRRISALSIRGLAGAGLVAAALTAGLSGSAHGQQPAEDNALPAAVVPPALNPPAGQVLLADFAARGVQVYQCTSGAWTFLEPAANLTGWAKRYARWQTAIHFRGPSWESTEDGSLVEAKAVASSPVSGSIPELLLQATKNRGDGVFGHVTYIQRLATTGGAVPTGTCTAGQTTAVPYRAEYRFFVPAS